MIELQQHIVQQIIDVSNVKVRYVLCDSHTRNKLKYKKFNLNSILVIRDCLWSNIFNKLNGIE